jgi:hypothetical protein
MRFGPKKPETEKENYSLDAFQRLALGGMFVLTLLTFIGANLHAYLWQSSDWLVSTVLPAVVVKLTNSERADLAEAPLRRSAVLDAAAQMKANHMVKNEYFAHYAPNGTSPWYWFEQAGYTYAHAGENLAIHFTDSSEVVDAWMKSPTHRENIVNGNFTEIGVGTAKGEYEGYDTVYVVQLFGTPAAPPKPVVAKPVVAAASTPAPAPVSAPTPTPVTLDLPEITPQEIESLEDGDETVLAANTPKEELETPEIATSTATTTASTTSEIEKESRNDDVVMFEKSTIATSSGLAPISIDEPPVLEDDNITGAVATKPHTLLQIIYTLFGFIVVGLLTASVVVEAKKTRYVQMAYGFGLLAIMAGLWYIHVLLTTGAVIV